MLSVTAIPALQDNYIWALHDDAHAALVDPGEAAPAVEFLEKHGLRLTAILCTHRHRDHIGGIAELRGVYNVPVYGRPHPDNPHITNGLQEGGRLRLDKPDADFVIMEIPGHVDDHVAYAGAGMVFCGDLLFGAGCGRNFEGTLAQLHHSMQRLAELPDDTRVYCAHEYTAANLRFALACEPNNPAIRERIQSTQQLREQKRPTLPSTIAQEKATNPFLRCTEPELIRTLQARGLAETGNLAVFTALRNWRNTF